MKLKNSNNGSILIFVLWTLVLLTVFAVNIGLKVKQRIELLSRVEDRNKLHYIAEAGVKKGIAVLKQDLESNGPKYTTHGKHYRHNNEDKFYKVKVGDGYFNVKYEYYDYDYSKPKTRYGFVDEESKININTASRNVLARLIKNVLNLPDEKIVELVNGIIDWREVGQATAEGFYSNDYYQSLEYPYESKSAYFEVPIELILVNGFTKEIYDSLMPYITIYGNGQVNINTASKNVLLALGITDLVAEKILAARRGFDEKDATIDDFVFQRSYDVASEMKRFVELSPDEVKQLDYLNSHQLINTNSFYYNIHSEGFLGNSKLDIVCIYNSKGNIIEFWREK